MVAKESLQQRKSPVGQFQSGRSRLRELFITKFKSQFKRGFTYVVVTFRAGRLREWSQGELRLYSNLETFALGAPTWRPEPNRNICH